MDHKELLQLSRQLSPTDVCAQLLALCVVEYSYTPNLSIALELNDAEGKLMDTGRGMRLTPDKGDTLAHAERALTGFYPCLPSSPEFDAILRELVWGKHGSLGPSVANFACRSLKFTSMRDGEVWSQSYSDGTPSGPAVRLGSTDTTGTIIDFKTAAPINHAVVATLVEALRSRIQGLFIVLRSRGRSQ
jgi:DNA gyrase/topoisomerase IV subunit B